MGEGDRSLIFQKLSTFSQESCSEGRTVPHRFTSRLLIFTNAHKTNLNCMLKKRQIKELKTRNKIDRVNELGVRFPNRKAFHGFHIQGE